MPRKKIPLVQGFSMSLVCGLVGLASFGGCSAAQPPTAVVSQAELAVREVGQSQAAQHAPRELSNARQKYDQAKRALDAERYTEARRLAEQALVDAELAETKAEAVSARQAAQELQKALEALRTEAGRMSRNLLDTTEERV